MLKRSLLILTLLATSLCGAKDNPWILHRDKVAGWEAAFPARPATQTMPMKTPKGTLNVEMAMVTANGKAMGVITMAMPAWANKEADQRDVSEAFVRNMLRVGAKITKRQAITCVGYPGERFFLDHGKEGAAQALTFIKDRRLYIVLAAADSLAALEQDPYRRFIGSFAFSDRKK